MTAVIITGGIDLSVGAVLVLSGMVIGMTMNAGMSIWLAVPLALGASLAGRRLQRRADRLRRRAALRRDAGHAVDRAQPGAWCCRTTAWSTSSGPTRPQLLALGGGFVELPLPFVDAIRCPTRCCSCWCCCCVTGFAFRWTRWGRYLFAIGGNERAATLTGVPVKRDQGQRLHVLRLCAGIAGILEVGWLGTITTGLGQGMELTVIAAAVIGGANLIGRRRHGLRRRGRRGADRGDPQQPDLLGISTFWQGTFVGSFIIIAVLFDRLRARGANE